MTHRFETTSQEPVKDPMLSHAAAIADAATQLKPLSHSTSQLIAMNASPNVSTTDLVNVIVHDQVLAATLLREANSAASAASDSISTVDAALVRLGTSRVLSVAIRLSLSGQMGAAVPQYRLSEGQLALLSVTGSLAAEVVRERSKVSLPPELSTAALLRDIGVLVMASFLDAPHLLLLDVVKDAGTPLSESERMVLDANHGEAGGLLCQQWKLPESVRIGVQYHHDPAACDEPVAHGVFLADTVAHLVALRTGGGWSHSTPDPSVFATSAAALGIDADALDAMADVVIARFGDRNTGLTL